MPQEFFFCCAPEGIFNWAFNVKIKRKQIFKGI